MKKIYLVWLIEIIVWAIAVFVYNKNWIITGIAIHGLVVLSVFVWAKIATSLQTPIWFQKPIYKIWKQKITNVCKKSDPRFAYPMAIFIELKLDSIFEKSGILGAEKAIVQELNRIQNIWQVEIPQMICTQEQKERFKNENQTAWH